MRLYFALWPDASVVQALALWMSAAQACCGGRTMRSETLHLTLAFLGETDNNTAEALVAGIRRSTIEPGVLRLSRFGSFRKPGVVWCGPEEGEAAAGVHAVQQALWSWLTPLGLTPSPEPFRPHVTLLRNARTDVLPEETPPAISWHYSRYSLIVSEPDGSGRRYRELAASC